MKPKLGPLLGVLGMGWFVSILLREEPTIEWQEVLSLPVLMLVACLVELLWPTKFVRSLLLAVSALLLLMFVSPATGVSVGDRIVFVSYFATLTALLWLGGGWKRTPPGTPFVSR